MEKTPVQLGATYMEEPITIKKTDVFSHCEVDILPIPDDLKRGIREWDGTTPIPRGPNLGFLDRFGNEWKKGPSRTVGRPFEWDVQLSRTGKEQIRMGNWRWFARQYFY